MDEDIIISCGNMSKIKSHKRGVSDHGGVCWYMGWSEMPRVTSKLCRTCLYEARGCLRVGRKIDLQIGNCRL